MGLLPSAGMTRRATPTFKRDSLYGVYMGSRNCGVGTRCMTSAARILLDREIPKKNLSFQSVSSIHQAWSKFSNFAHEEGIRRLEHITSDLAINYGKELAQKVNAHECSAGYAQRLVSAVNTVMKLVNTRWRAVKPVKDCGIPKRMAVRVQAPSGMDKDDIDKAVAELRVNGLIRAAAIVQLAWCFGLRVKEASLLDTNKALAQCNEIGRFHVSAGTKGGRARFAELRHSYQLVALRESAEVQQQNRSVLKSDSDWHAFRERELFEARAVIKKHNIKQYHDLRAAYACHRYKQITGNDAPVLTGVIVDREADRIARQQIALELGHNRISVVSAYVGGMA